MHRFIAVVEDSDADKVKTMANLGFVEISHSKHAPILIFKLIDGGKEPTDEELEEALTELTTYDAVLADAFRSDLARGDVDRLSAYRALKQFARTRASHVTVPDCGYPVTEES